jgi:flagellin-like protein
MSMEKKAVSPLLATIMLIVFAMVLGVIVMNVGGAYLPSAEKTTEKADVLDIVDKCVNTGAITEEEGILLISSLK